MESLTPQDIKTLIDIVKQRRGYTGTPEEIAKLAVYMLELAAKLEALLPKAEQQTDA